MSESEERIKRNIVYECVCVSRTHTIHNAEAYRVAFHVYRYAHEIKRNLDERGMRNGAASSTAS